MCETSRVYFFSGCTGDAAGAGAAGLSVFAGAVHELKEAAFEMLLSRRAINRGYFRADTIRRLLDEHVRERASWHYLLWTLLMLEMWHRTYIDGDRELFRQRALAGAARLAETQEVE